MRCRIPSPLTSANILQANVTIITGIFILLATSILSQKPNRRIVKLIIISPIPFILSIGFLFGAPFSWNEAFFYLWAGLIFLGALGYLIITLALIAKVISQ